MRAIIAASLIDYYRLSEEEQFRENYRENLI